VAKSQTKLKQIQRQALSPLQKLSGELLELSVDELNERIEKEKENNPYLEEIEDNTQISSYTKLWNSSNEFDKDQINNNIPTTETLAEDLMNQLRLSNITEKEYKIGENIIGNLDEKGYLSRSLSAIIDDIYFDTYEDLDLSLVEKVLKLIQSFEPAGIAARTHQECLLLQLQRKDQKDTIVQLSEQIIKQYWEDFYNNQTKHLSSKLKCSEEELNSALHLIQGLSLSPGYIDTTLEKEQYITPDILLWNDNGKIKYKLNRQSNKKLNISQDLKTLLGNLKRNQQNEETIKFLQEKITSTQLFIDAYNNRTQTLNNFMQHIVKYQENYFQDGDVMQLRPMKYEDIKKLTDYSESTISRIANDKYIQTHFGTFKIKKLFTKSIETQTGEQISTDTIRNIITELIESENKENPLTDQEILEHLQKEGIELSRRTISKYRQQLGIETSAKRKQI
jgi:RNA polymerase sigma-54 factor